MGNATGGNATGGFGGGGVGGGSAGGFGGTSTSWRPGAAGQRARRRRLGTLAWRVPDGNWVLHWRIRARIASARRAAERALGRRSVLVTSLDLRDKRGPTTQLTVRLDALGKRADAIDARAALDAFRAAFEQGMARRGLMTHRREADE